MRKMFGFLLLCVMSQAFAAGTNTVRVYDASNMVVTGHTNKSFVLGSDSPSGDATIETAPAKVYLPIARETTAPVFNNQPYFSLYRTEGVVSLFGIASTSSDQYIAFPLSVTTGATANYVYAAVKSDDTKYYAIAKYTTSISNVTNEAISFPVSPYSICDKIINAGGTKCNSLGLTSAVEVNPPRQILVYFFQAPTTTSITLGNEIAPGDAAYNGGIYFEVSMSNRVFETSELTVSLTEVKTGDGRLILSVSASADMTDFKKMLIFDHGHAASAGAHEPIGNYTGGTFIDLNITGQSGEITVNKVSDGRALQNDKDYWFSPVLIDKYKFATTLPAPIVGRAQKIEQLLEKQACFLLTAGFGEEHYVIEYFRNFRDHMLAKSWLGRKFINFYYETAPEYALIIYKSNILRSVIRGMAYCLYFIFNYITLLSIGFASIIAFIILKRVKKWQHQRKISPF